MKGDSMEGWFSERRGSMKGRAVKEPPPHSGQQAGGTHPTGMLSCSRFFQVICVSYLAVFEFEFPTCV